MKVINTDLLYLDLLQDLGLAHGDDLTVYPWDNLSIVNRKVLASTFFKKFEDGIDASGPNRAALDKFLSVNLRCGAWQREPQTFEDVVLMQYLSGYLQKFFIYDNGDCILGDHVDILSNGDVGPGTSIGPDLEDFYTKLFDSDLSTTRSGLYDLYVDYISRYPLWRDADESRKSALGSAAIVAGSRFGFVPKNTQVSRTICVEPVLNMFYQLGIGELIAKRLKGFFQVDLSKQPDVNRTLAYEGSVHGELVTIDLSSASDSLSLRMLESFLPRRVNDWLLKVRSPVTEVPNYGTLELNMVSTMGNGFTFALQTALFCCVVAACFDAHGSERWDSPYDPDNVFGRRLPNWAVFGDDIIVPTVIHRKVLRLLTLLGFEVNSDKTFVEGPFRESCGLDFFKGVNVRGVYLTTLRTRQDRYSSVNRLNRWTDRTGISLPRTVTNLLKGQPKQAVPTWENDDAGVHVPSWAHKVLGIKYRTDRNGTRVYHACQSNQKKYSILASHICTPGDCPSRRYNASGLELSLLAGRLVCAVRRFDRDPDWFNKPVPVLAYSLVRPDQVRYTTKLRKAPDWDRPGPLWTRYRDPGRGAVLSWTTQGPFKGPVGGDGAKAPLLINLISAW